MARFFFDLVYPGKTLQDPEGSDCANLAAAQIEARAVLRELAIAPLTADRLFDPGGICICNESGKLLALVSIMEAFDELFPQDGSSRAGRGRCL